MNRSRRFTTILSSKSLHIDDEAIEYAKAHDPRLGFQLPPPDKELTSPERIRALRASKINFEEAVNSRDTLREIAAFEKRSGGKPLNAAPPAIPEFDVDAYEAYVTPTAAQFYEIYKQKKKNSAQDATLQRSHIITKKKWMPKRDEPPPLNRPARTLNMRTQSRPFYLPTNSGDRGIPLVDDDLLEIRRKNQIAYEQRASKLKAQSENEADEQFRRRATESRDTHRRLHLRSSQLFTRSGQEAVYLRHLASTQPQSSLTTQRKRDPAEEEFIKSFGVVDDEFWLKEKERNKRRQFIVPSQSTAADMNTSIKKSPTQAIHLELEAPDDGIFVSGGGI